MARTIYAVPMARTEQPKYQQIADDLRARMAAGEYPPDSRLPSKADLMSEYRVALATVNNAIRVLREEGRAETVQGVATFARTPQDGQHSSEYGAVMSRVDAIAEEVRQLRKEVAAMKTTHPG